MNPPVRTDLLSDSAARERIIASLPVGLIPSELPIASAAAEVVRAIQGNQVVIIQGETGCGKTTQLPKLALQAGRGVGGMVGLTQPRRVAARTICARIASELGVAPGSIVGHQVRFDDRSNASTIIKVVTDGILLAQMGSDRLLTKFDTLIVDEAHERSLNIDFLLGCLRSILHRRSDLKIIIASATIDAAKFSRHFADAPVIEIPGRTFPVETRYRPTKLDDFGDPDYPSTIADAVEECLREQKGDGLVFLPGEREIAELQEMLQGRLADTAEVVPFFARLSSDAQDYAMTPGTKRRVVLATNIAETSLTVPRIRFVVDCGLARVLRYNPRLRLQRLPVERISRASAMQRTGRCGRVGPGLCIRTFAPEEFEEMPQWNQPEIQRVNLASVILQMAGFGLGDIRHFPLVDPPSHRSIEEGLATLTELGALTSTGRLTTEGALMAKLPIDPRLARVLLESIKVHCLPEALVIAAGWSVADPRVHPADKPDSASMAHSVWKDQRSDVASTLRLWKLWRNKSSELGSSALRTWCRQSFLSQQRLREWDEIHRQITRLVQQGWKKARPWVHRPLADTFPADAIHACVLAGFVSNVAQRTIEGEYELANAQKFRMHSSSALGRANARWLVATEVMDTGRRVGRTAVPIAPQWIERVAGHLVKRAVSEPHWVKQTGQVAAWQRVTLGSLVVSPRSRVPYGPVDPRGAREVFIQSALIDEEIVGKSPEFLRKNRQLLENLLAEEARRRCTLVGGDASRYEFYDARIPLEIHSWPAFLRWFAAESRNQPHLLCMRRADLVAASGDGDGCKVEDSIDLNGIACPLEFCHQPGDERDGASLRIPLESATQIDTRSLGWGVPGMLSELCEAYIRSLPKHLRQRLIPAGEVATGAAQALAGRTGEFAQRLAEYLSTVAATRIAAVDFSPANIDRHLMVRVAVVDHQGNEIDADRDGLALAKRVRERAMAAFEAAAARQSGAWRRRVIHRWEDDLPQELPLMMGAPEGMNCATVFPCLDHTLENGSWRVVLRLCPDELSARQAMRRGTIALLADAIAKSASEHAENHPAWTSIATGAIVARLDEDSLLGDIAVAIATALVDRSGEPPRTRQRLIELREHALSGMWRLAQETVEQTQKMVGALLELSAVTAQLTDRSLAQCVTQRMEQLVTARPLRNLSTAQLQAAPRRVMALVTRVKKASAKGSPWDRALEAQFAPWQQHAQRMIADAHTWQQWLRAQQVTDAVEEFAVALWAQELGTAYPVSAVRLEKLILDANG